MAVAGVPGRGIPVAEPISSRNSWLLVSINMSARERGEFLSGLVGVAEGVVPKVVDDVLGVL